MKKTGSPLFWLLLGMVLLAGNARGQEQKPTPKIDEVVRVDTGLVQTDVMVLDKNHRFVKGLQPSQFRLRVNDKPREILFFEQVVAGSSSEDARLAAARGRTAGAEGRSLVSDRGRTIYFYIDDYHLSAKSVQHVRELLTEFLQQVKKEEDEVTIVTATGQLGFFEQPTRENVVLLKAISNLNHKNFIATDAERTSMTEYQARAIVGGDRRLMDYFVEQLLKETALPRPRTGSTQITQSRGRSETENRVMSRAQAIVEQIASYSGATLLGLDRLMRSAASLPDRKILFLISEGFILDKKVVGEQAEVQISDAAARSGTVIYAIDATGLMSGVPSAATRMTFDNFGRLMGTNVSGIVAAQQPLFALSVDSGGRAFINTNNITSSAIAEALQETNEYYLLAWRPEEEEVRSGKYHSISLEIVERPELQLRGRDGFMSASEPSQPVKRDGNSKKKTSDPLAGALHSIFPQRDLPVSLSLGYLDTPEKLATVTATIEVARAALGNQTGELELLGMVINEQGKSVSTFDQGLTISDVSRRVTYNHQMQFAPGLYQVRVAVRDKKGGRVGSASEWISVPNLKDGSFALSSLFIGEMNDEAMASGKLPINADHRFRANSRLGLFTYIYNPQKLEGASDVGLQIQILRDNQPVITKPSIKLEDAGNPDPARIPYGEDLSLAQLPAGKYSLRVTAIDRLSKKTATQSSRFTIY